MSRPIAARRGSRVSPRRLAAVAFAAVGILLVSACSSGQIAETAEEVPAVDGASASVGSIDLRDVTLAYPSTGFYPAGSKAPLQLAIINTSTRPDVLVGVHSPDARTAVGTTGTAPTSAVTGTGTVRLPIGPQETLLVGRRPSVTLVGLTARLRPGRTIPVTLRFARAGAVTIPVPIATPQTPLPQRGGG